MELRRGRSGGYKGGVVALPYAMICIFLCLLYVCAVVVASGFAVDVPNAAAMKGRRKRTPLVQGGGAVPVTAMGAGKRRRRRLSGPGSYPPRCTYKCGKCTPCRPVHVPVPPSAPVTTEYYPEAWRCKCGRRLYMP